MKSSAASANIGKLLRIFPPPPSKFWGKRMITCGIDWADAEHQVCVLDAAGRKLRSFAVAHTPEGFEKLGERLLKEAGSPENVRIALETDSSLLVDFLCERGYTLYVLNPKQTDRYRDRHRMSHSKSDDFDAFVLADAVRTDVHVFRAVLPLDETTVTLRALTRTREGMVGRKVACQNELTAALKRYFPAGLRLFDSLDQPVATAFLQQYPTHALAAEVCEADLVAFLKEHGFLEYQAKQRAGRVVATLRAPQLKPAASAAAAYPLAVRALARELENQVQGIAALEQQIAQTLAQHPQKDIFGSLPGFAEVLTPVLAAEVGVNLSRFSGAQEMRTLAGTCPVTSRSGKHISIHFRRACNEHLRRAVHLGSQAALNTAGWARELFDRLRARGCTYGRALRAVGDQLIQMLYAMLKHNTCYDEDYYLQMRDERNKPRPAPIRA